MSVYCDFIVTMDVMLCDQLIFGLKDQHIIKRLLSEEVFTFKKCVELNLAIETANNDVRCINERS